jgi:predicted methyltransferase
MRPTRCSQPGPAAGLCVFLLLSACGGAPPGAPGATPPASSPPSPPPSSPGASGDAAAAIHAAVAAADRSVEDRALDAGRKPAEMLAFFGVAPNMRVAEIQAGSGYTAELLGRVVGPSGQVFAQNNRFVLAKYAEKPWSARLGKPVNQSIVRVDRELDDPLPPEAKDLDLVIDVLFYHDTVWMKTDRAKMNASIFAALKHGGAYVVIDHSGRAGSGVSETQTLHRIEEAVVREELERAGFKLTAEGGFLRNPQDTRDWNAAPTAAAERRGTSDRFALKLVKP